MGGAHRGAGGHARVAEQAEATGRVGNFVRQSGKRERHAPAEALMNSTDHEV